MMASCPDMRLMSLWNVIVMVIAGVNAMRMIVVVGVGAIAKNARRMIAIAMRFMVVLPYVWRHAYRQAGR